MRGDLDYQVGTLYTFALTGENKIRDYIIQSINPKGNGYVNIKLINYDPDIYGPDTEAPPDPPEGTDPNEPGTSTIVLDSVPSGTDIPTHDVFIEIAAAETLAFSAAPTGTYEADDNTGPAIQTFLVDKDGTWSVTGFGDTFDTDSGDYRPGTTGNDIDNYEIKITSAPSGSGQVNALGGIILDSFVPLTGGQGIRVFDTSSGVTESDITVEIREISTPANTTGVASFTLDCDGAMT